MKLIAIDSLSDAEIRDVLIKIDVHDDIDVTSWEANFLESVVYRQKHPLIVRQRACAALMIRKYQSKL